MTIEIFGDVDISRLYCTGSFTKLTTTYVCLSLLAEKYDLNAILDDDNFLDSICCNPSSKDFLAIFKQIIGSKFSIRDVCSFYNGLPYTFDITEEEVEAVDHGQPFKHHGILDETRFLSMCRSGITQIDPNHSKFHYSELAIIFIGFLIEKIYDIQIETLYQKYILKAFSLDHSLFSRTMPANVYRQDLSDQYDYPSIAIQDHGYFCYSNGFYTTLNDQRHLVECLLNMPVFGYMIDIRNARAASNKVMNGLTVELRIVNDDVICGYEGLSYSGCNIWAYSTKNKKGYITTTNDEDKAYPLIYDKFGYSQFDNAPDYTQKIYKEFLANQHYDFSNQAIPAEYVGTYHRVNINDKILDMDFTVDEHFIVIRNPEEIKYDVVFDHGTYRTKCKDNMHGIKIGFYQAKSGQHYMCFDGTCYKKVKYDAKA